MKRRKQGTSYDTILNEMKKCGLYDKLSTFKIWINRMKPVVDGDVSQHVLQGLPVGCGLKGLKKIQTCKLFHLFLQVSGPKVLGLLFFCIIKGNLLKLKSIADSC